MLDRPTLIVISSSSIVAILSALPATRDVMPISIISAGLHVGDTLFHEIGHSIFSWLFGMPSVPAIFTFFYADTAGGVTLMWERQIPLQALSFSGLAYLCYWLRKYYSPFFIYAVIFAVFIFILAFTEYYQLVINYMGHGCSILMGGVFLYRAWMNIQVRHAFERWLNCLFGVFLIFDNFLFSFELVFDSVKRWDYSQSMSVVGHHDFVKIATQLNLLDVQLIAWFTMFLSASTFLVATLFAAKQKVQVR